MRMDGNGKVGEVVMIECNFGEDEGYTGESCSECSRYRVIHYSKGFDICEKCGWCKQLNRYVSDDEYFTYGDWFCTDVEHKEGR